MVDGFIIFGYGAEELLNGGINIQNASLTISNCIIIQFYEYNGSGVYINGGNPSIINCTFSNNNANGNGGGGVYINGGNPSITNCTFSNNYGVLGGGVLSAGNTSITNCIFVNNNADIGGGVYINSGYTSITNCSFYNNTAYKYGGAINSETCVFSISNSVINSNFSPYGAGLYSYVSTFSISTTSFSINIGGAIFVENGNGTLTNVNVTDNNSTSISAGGISVDSNLIDYNYQNSFISGTFVVITGNTGGGAGGIYLNNNASNIFTLTNYTLKNNYYLNEVYPQFNELYCKTYGVPNSVCNCDFPGYDFGYGCLDTKPLGAIVGGVVGAAVGLCLISIVTFVLLQKRHNRKTESTNS